MPIGLDHILVPARDKVAAAKLLAKRATATLVVRSLSIGHLRGR